jgi:hypothetical protein
MRPGIRDENQSQSLLLLQEAPPVYNRFAGMHHGKIDILPTLMMKEMPNREEASGKLISNRESVFREPAYARFWFARICSTLSFQMSAAVPAHAAAYSGCGSSR